MRVNITDLQERSTAEGVECIFGCRNHRFRYFAFSHVALKKACVFACHFDGFPHPVLPEPMNLSIRKSNFWIDNCLAFVKSFTQVQWFLVVSGENSPFLTG